MKILYLDCGMGAAGDMLSAALLELSPDPDAIVNELNAIGIPGVKYIREKSVKHGVTGTRMKVLVNGVEEGEIFYHHEHEHGEHAHEHDAHDARHHEHGEHHHSGMNDIERIVSDLNTPEEIKSDILAVYHLIADAESAVHGESVKDIHFHEVGTMDAIADVAAVCFLTRRLAPDKIISSPVHVGSGHVHCAHGILPVPAPATALILRDIPIYSDSHIQGELCTPTGAALLKYFAAEFGEMPVMKVNAIGYGMGKKDFPRANCLRAMLGDTPESGARDTDDHANRADDINNNNILELSCNLDDMTAEAVGFAMEKLYQSGAKEVYTIPVGMKKNRPGVLLCVLCDIKRRENMIEILFRHTTTIGIRETIARRYTLNREEKIFRTPYGEARRKYASGYGVTRMKWEYDDLARIAREQDMSLKEVRHMLREYTRDTKNAENTGNGKENES